MPRLLVGLFNQIHDKEPQPQPLNILLMRMTSASRTACVSPQKSVMVSVPQLSRKSLKST